MADPPFFLQVTPKKRVQLLLKCWLVKRLYVSLKTNVLIVAS